MYTKTEVVLNRLSTLFLSNLLGILLLVASMVKWTYPDPCLVLSECYVLTLNFVKKQIIDKLKHIDLQSK